MPGERLGTRETQGSAFRARPWAVTWHSRRPPI